MCLSSELCELSCLPQMVQVLAASAVVELCERMCLVSSGLEHSTFWQIGHTYFSPHSSATGRICE